MWPAGWQPCISVETQVESQKMPLGDADAGWDCGIGGGFPEALTFSCCLQLPKLQLWGRGRGDRVCRDTIHQAFFPEPQSDNFVIRPISLLRYIPHSWHYLHGNRHASMTLRLYFSACLLILGLNSLTCICQNRMVSSILLNYLSDESWNSRNQTALFQTHAMQLITCVQTWAS